MLPISEMNHLNNGECADIYEIDARTVLKLGKLGWSKDLLYQEYLNGKLISDSDIPTPKVYDFIEVQGRYGYTMDKLNDLTFLDLMWKYPWKVISYAKKMAAIHAHIHSVKPPKELPILVDKYREFISLKENIRDDIKKLIFQELEQLNANGECSICHGDFHPINILVDENRYFVIDWVLAAQGNPEADVAGTYLITRMYSSNVNEKNFFKKIVGALGGKLIANIYLKEYISITGSDKKSILRWIPIRAATYIDVGLPVHLEQAFKRIVENHYK